LKSQLEFPSRARASRQHVNSTDCGGLLSVCPMLLFDRQQIPVREELRLANGTVAQYIEGRRTR